MPKWLDRLVCCKCARKPKNQDEVYGGPSTSSRDVYTPVDTMERSARNGELQRTIERSSSRDAIGRMAVESGRSTSSSFRRERSQPATYHYSTVDVQRSGAAAAGSGNSYDRRVTARVEMDSSELERARVVEE
ncbi:hypothetical protein PFISCL1PPCAC_18245, partial [Pristionchus fissidentatus]